MESLVNYSLKINEIHLKNINLNDIPLMLKESR